MEPETSEAREAKTTATRTYHAEIDDGSGGETDIVAPSMAVALRLAEEWARDGDWDAEDATAYARLSVRTARGPTHESWVRIDPPEPRCDSPAGHDWVEGRAYGHGGGVQGTDTCSRCDTLRQWDTWSRRVTTADGETGEEGVESVRYETGP